MWEKGNQVKCGCRLCSKAGKDISGLRAWEGHRQTGDVTGHCRFHWALRGFRAKAERKHIWSFLMELVFTKIHSYREIEFFFFFCQSSKREKVLVSRTFWCHHPWGNRCQRTPLLTQCWAVGIVGHKSCCAVVGVGGRALPNRKHQLQIIFITLIFWYCWERGTFFKVLKVGKWGRKILCLQG